jgi:probable addiction module antidote protein
MTTAFAPFDAATYLDSDEVIAEYLSAAAENPNLDVFLAALGDVAKARGMAQIARDAGLGRENLLEALGEGGRPRFETISAIIARARSEVRDCPAKRGHCVGAVTAAAPD